MSMRQGLPRDYGDVLGVMHSDARDPRRVALQESIQQRIVDAVLPILAEAVDTAVDSMHAELLHGRHKPALKDDDDEAVGASAADGDEVTLDTRVVLVAVGAQRLCAENDLLVVRTCLQNTREYKAVDETGVVFDLDDGPTVEAALQWDGPFTPRQLPRVDGDDEDGDAGICRVVQALVDNDVLRVVR